MSLKLHLNPLKSYIYLATYFWHCFGQFKLALIQSKLKLERTLAERKLNMHFN